MLYECIINYNEYCCLRCCHEPYLIVSILDPNCWMTITTGCWEKAKEDHFISITSLINDSFAHLFSYHLCIVHNHLRLKNIINPVHHNRQNIFFCFLYTLLKEFAQYFNVSNSKVTVTKLNFIILFVIFYSVIL